MAKKMTISLNEKLCKELEEEAKKAGCTVRDIVNNIIKTRQEKQILSLKMELVLSELKSKNLELKDRFNDVEKKLILSQKMILEIFRMSIESDEHTRSFLEYLIERLGRDKSKEEIENIKNDIIKKSIENSQKKFEKIISYL